MILPFDNILSLGKLWVDYKMYTRMQILFDPEICVYAQEALCSINGISLGYVNSVVGVFDPKRSRFSLSKFP